MVPVRKWGAEGRGQSGGKGEWMLAAVVIGVDKVGGGLPKLKAAASGAEQVAEWLRRSDYEVRLFTDANGRVGRQPIFQAVTDLVGLGSVERLVVYFGGHGFLNGPGDELWVLSDAPLDASEAVNVSLSQMSARYLGIPEIVFISDACRVRAHSGVLGSISGASIFPNVKPNQNDTEIDLYYGTWPGDPALERDTTEAEGAHGLFTQELLLAHRAAPPEALLRVGDREFVRSRWLKKVLQDRVDARASEIALRLTQRPNIQIQTYDSYIAQHEAAAEIDAVGTEHPGQFKSMAGGEPDAWEAHPRPDGHAKGDISGQGGSLGSGWYAPAPHPIVVDGHSKNVVNKGLGASIVRATAHVTREYISRVDFLRNAEPPAVQARRGGGGERLTCVGDVLEEIALGPGVTTPAGFKAGAKELSLDIARPASQVAVRFSDGTGMLLPMLPCYNCEVVRADGRTLLVGYTWIEYRDPRLIDLRAQVMSAATLGLLDRTREAARDFARQTRQVKKIDPALGLVASLSYTLAGDDKGAASVRSYMRKDLGVDLFDTWLLGGAGEDHLPIVPALPLLSQTWSFLDLFDAPLAQEAKQLRRVPGFWTVFEAGSMDAIIKIVSEGEKGEDIDG